MRPSTSSVTPAAAHRKRPGICRRGLLSSFQSSAFSFSVFWAAKPCAKPVSTPEGLLRPRCRGERPVMSDADKDAEIASLKAQNATLQARVKELETGTARLSVRLSGALLLALPSAARSAPWPPNARTPPDTGTWATRA